VREVLGSHFGSAGFAAALLGNLCQQVGALGFKLLLESGGVLGVHVCSFFHEPIMR
jgi:hypothetical protein